MSVMSTSIGICVSHLSWMRVIVSGNLSSTGIIYDTSMLSPNLASAIVHHCHTEFFWPTPAKGGLKKIVVCS